MSKLSLPRAPQRMTTGFAFSYVDRAIREGVAVRQFGKPEMARILEFFGEAACVFCGSQPISRWDHLVPVKKGGDTVLGNMVPACSRCDDSKQHYDFESWMSGNARHSPTTRGVPDVELRVRRLKDYATAFGYEPRELDDRCPAEELAGLKARIEEVRAEIDIFINKYSERRDAD